MLDQDSGGRSGEGPVGSLERNEFAFAFRTLFKGSDILIRLDGEEPSIMVNDGRWTATWKRAQATHTLQGIIQNRSPRIEVHSRQSQYEMQGVLYEDLVFGPRIHLPELGVDVYESVRVIEQNSSAVETRWKMVFDSVSDINSNEIEALVSVPATGKVDPVRGALTINFVQDRRRNDPPQFSSNGSPVVAAGWLAWSSWVPYLVVGAAVACAFAVRHHVARLNRGVRP